MHIFWVNYGLPGCPKKNSQHSTVPKDNLSEQMIQILNRLDSPFHHPRNSIIAPKGTESININREIHLLALSIPFFKTNQMISNEKEWKTP